MVKEILARLHEPTTPVEEIRAWLNHTYGVIQTNALYALATKLYRQPELREDAWIDIVVPIISDNPNANFRMAGGIKVLHLALNCLLVLQTPAAIERANKLIQTLSIDDQRQLEWFHEAWKDSLKEK